MHPTLDAIKSELVALATQLKTSVPSNEPFNVAHNNWSFPGVTRDELIADTTSLIQLIEQRGGDTLKTNETLLADYTRRLNFIRGNTIPQMWGSPQAAVPVYLTTLDGLRKALDEALQSDMPTVQAEKIEAGRILKRTLAALRAIEARTLEVDSRSTDLSEKVERIEQAHEAADQLPTDLASLKELRNTLERLLTESTTDRNTAGEKLSEINGIREQLDQTEKKASAILDRCDEAYRATTSEGLASAFADRSRSLSNSMWVWVVGLVIALVVGANIGSTHLHTLATAIMNTSMQGKSQDSSIWVELILTVLSIGAPVWFAWVATKQIGQRFRLAEDYGYKASISKAYEGYRREAALLDPAFQSRLFSSALTRLDEIPLRLVEAETHGSPGHELASSPVVRQAVATVPGFMAQVTELARQMLPKGKETEASKQANPAKLISVAPSEDQNG